MGIVIGKIKFMGKEWQEPLTAQAHLSVGLLRAAGGVLGILAFVCGWKEEKRPCGKRGLTRLTSERVLEDCAEGDFSLSFLLPRALRCFL